MSAAARLDRRLAPVLDERRAAGLYRTRRTLEGPQGPSVRVDDRDCLSFCSNDYLALAGHPAPARALQRAARRWRAGSGAAHLIVGHTAEHAALEAELAEHVGRPRALLFATGYMANMGVINALTGPGGRVLEDRLNHASLLDGGWLCRGEMERYEHADPDDLGRRLAAGSGGDLIATDGVFSMDGDLAPLDALARQADRYDGHLMVDDAHGLGVLGPDGSGTLAELGLDMDDVPVYVGTLGKALGNFGAFVAGSETLIEFLIQRARTYVYTTAPPSPVAAATREALRRARAESWRREHLFSLVARFREGARQLGLSPGSSRTPIQPLIVGEPERASALSGSLLRRGILVTAIRPPTVPPGTARLRITLTAGHAAEDVDRLLDALDSARREAA